ncbi:hypothetical protein SAMN05518669_10515 [Variovorax sp. YR634]|uniref:hypothetical protein n=1 Tax=unclassified Variovorax TaxID=663243 RepID=UPI00089C44C3|nr:MULTISPECIES: hypothetical protein [unclassified Variovorax]SDX47456.1 hypothetical protein SAMN05518669_10515 [Variovorax sp. YR634]SOD28514.1 hypothetical protein SAMN05518800_4090 [Variovorax sp. YR752]
MSNFIAAYGKELVALFVPLLTWFLNVGMKAKVRLVWSVPNEFTFLVADPSQEQGQQSSAFQQPQPTPAQPVQTQSAPPAPPQQVPAQPALAQPVPTPAQTPQAQAQPAQQPVTNVFTASVRLMNLGREPAKKVEVVFNWKPDLLNMWPIRAFEESIDNSRRYIIKFDSFAPKEELRIEVMNVNKPLPALLTVRCDQCVGQRMDIRWVRALPPAVIGLMQFLCFLGFGTSIYGLILLLQLLVLRTPLG